MTNADTFCDGPNGMDSALTAGTGSRQGTVVRHLGHADRAAACSPKPSSTAGVSPAGPAHQCDREDDRVRCVVVIHRWSSNDPAIRLLDQLAIHAVDDAADLYLGALGDKLVPIFGKGSRARRALARGFKPHMCIGAYDRDRLVGLLGIQTADAGFIHVAQADLRPIYGPFGSFWRAGLMALLHHRPLAGEARIDGVVVAEAYRCRGIGTNLIAAMETWAACRRLSMVSLEVADANPRAQRLYHRVGFQTVRAQTVWPYRSLFGWQPSSVMVKLLV